MLVTNKSCLSCRHSQVSTERNQLRIFCQRGYLENDGSCADYSDIGTSRLLDAIKTRIRQAQQRYRGRFNILQPDCSSCVQNCCTTPFLNRTPFYPEDGLYYLLCDQPVPNVPKGLKHCMFFHNGCSLPSDLRPHACIEYKCIYQQDQQIDNLGRVINYTTIDLLAVATREYQDWRGEYTTEDRPSLKQRGLKPGKIYDRFDREWQPTEPIKDLLIIYEVDLP
jgi:hypothetical protein